MPGYADDQIIAIVSFLCGFSAMEPATEPTPIYDDIVEAREAGFTGEYHPHWRLEQAWAADALAEAEAEHFGAW